MAPLKASPKSSTSSPVLSSDQSKQFPEQTRPSASVEHFAPAVENSDSDDDKPLSSRKGKEPDKASKDHASTKSDNKQKWTSLVHNGVIFPPPYEPHGVKMLYNGKQVDLTPEQEEVATMFAMMTDTDYARKKRFRDNFWMDWRKFLGEKHVIQELDACDFQPIYEWWCQEKEKKKQLSAEEKKAAKEEKSKQEEKYKWAVIDGVKEEVQSFRVEPPGLFRGRACWDDPIFEEKTKNVMLGSSSSLRGQSDKEKYEKARKLKDNIEQNVKAIAPNQLEFDFLGKDSIRYHQTHQVDLPVYNAIKQFQKGKSSSDKLFDQLDTTILNASLKEMMPGLTTKVFRTYNASITLDNMLNEKTKKEADVSARVAVYDNANKKVAILCNHQRAESKTFGEQISKLNKKIEDLKGVMKALETDLVRAREGKSPLKDGDGKQKRNLTPEALEKKMAQTTKNIETIERKIADKEDKKNVATETSKTNYLDPRITVAWYF
ncbi:hypothetical protein ACLB2K_018078 [Fragaria x ananassa]